MAITVFERRRNLGLAGGSLWLIIVGVAYAAWALLNVRSALATSLLVAIGMYAVGMYSFGVVTIRRVRKMPFAPSDRRSEARRIWLQFALIVAAEAAAIIAVVNTCVSTHHGRFIVPLILVIVGLHFLPLAKVVRGAAVLHHRCIVLRYLHRYDDPGANVGTHWSVNELDYHTGGWMWSCRLGDGMGGIERSKTICGGVSGVVVALAYSPLSLLTQPSLGLRPRLG